MTEETLHRQNIIACVWDFDKTLAAGYMQGPVFERFGIDEDSFWREVNGLPELYAARGVRVSPETVYLNHMLTYVRTGRMAGLNNALLRELGADIALYPGLPEFFTELAAVTATDEAYRRHRIQLEHYIISTGLAEMIRGNAISSQVQGIFGSEFIENPAPPHYAQQDELVLDGDVEISQIGFIVDNTIKTRFIFEINKGCNVDPKIDVNAKMAAEDRRVPIRNMIYIADGPSDIPVFSVVKKMGGRTFAVFDRDSEAEFAQNDRLLQSGRIHAYGPADYTPGTTTSRWLRMHVRQLCERIVEEREYALATRVSAPPRHLHKELDELPPDELPAQGELLGD